MKKFSIIICTYMRQQPLLNLLQSVGEQSLYPNQIIIVDGSTNLKTKDLFTKNRFKNLEYYLVEENDRGLSKQRNFGIKKVSESINIVCFLDDDIVLKDFYFENLIKTYNQYPDALGVGGYISNDSVWKPLEFRQNVKINQFSFDGWVRKDGSRFVLRKKLGLDADRPPAHFPNFGHGRSVSFLPPSGKIYEVEQFMGGVASYPMSVLDSYKFSTYFEGYGSI